MSYVNFRMLLSRNVGLTVICLHANTACTAQTAQTVPTDWKTDCVGRMQISLPGMADIAVTPDDYLMSLLDLAPSKNAPPYSFPDGVVAGYTSLAYSIASLKISQPQSPAALSAQLKAHVNQRFTNVKKNYTNSVQSDGSKYSFAVVKTGIDNASIWQSTPNRFNAVIQLEDRLVDLNLTIDADSAWRPLEQLTSFLKAFQARPMFNIPKESGVCLPYMYARDSGKAARNVQMTYRLVDHPDVQITIKDETSTAREPGIRTQNAEPLPVIQSLWDQHLTQFAKDGKNEWPRGGRPVTLAGYKGLSSFVKFIRPDDKIDYGYAAVVRGDPNAKEDTPDLMVYVIRDSNNAKGKEPMPKDEFLKMAETIAASVKRRPVQ